MTEPDFQVEFNGVSILSTADGKMSVLDAIDAITESGCSQNLWKRLASDHPEVLRYCEAYSFQQGEKKLVVGSQGWEKIFMLLPEYFFVER